MFLIVFAVGVISFAIIVLSSNFFSAEEEKLKKLLSNGKTNEEEEYKDSTLATFFVSIASVFFILAVGTVFYMFVEEWNFLDSLYFCLFSALFSYLSLIFPLERCFYGFYCWIR